MSSKEQYGHCLFDQQNLVGAHTLYPFNQLHKEHNNVLCQ